MDYLLYKELSKWLLAKFGCKIWKITIDAGLSCPNRDGTKSCGGCIYCNEKGSGNGLFEKYSIEEQIQIQKSILKSKYKAEKYISYLQSYSNTYAEIPVLKKIYDSAVSDTDIVGLAVGTRPDTVNEEKIELIKSYSDNKYIWIEYGLQSANEKTLNLINRNHTTEDFFKAVKLTRRKNIDVVVHVIIGLPGETKKDILKTASFLSSIDIQGIKIHSLYIIKNTKLHEMYNQGYYKPIERDEYIDLICDFISNIPDNIVIHRLTGDPHRKELISPLWTLEKNKNIESIKNEMIKRKIYQGINLNHR